MTTITRRKFVIGTSAITGISLLPVVEQVSQVEVKIQFPGEDERPLGVFTRPLPKSFDMLLGKEFSRALQRQRERIDSEPLHGTRTYVMLIGGSHTLGRDKLCRNVTWVYVPDSQIG